MSTEQTFEPQVGVDAHPGLVITAVRYLPCGCAYERRITFCEPLPPGWAVDAARSLGMAMRLARMAHECPLNKPKETP